MRDTPRRPAVNSTTALTGVQASNSLADLAARIKTEHEASALALKHGLDAGCGLSLNRAPRPTGGRLAQQEGR